MTKATDLRAVLAEIRAVVAMAEGQPVPVEAGSAGVAEALAEATLDESGEARAVEVLGKVLGILEDSLLSAAKDLKALHRKFGEIGNALPKKREELMALQGALEQGIELLMDLRKIAPQDFQDLFPKGGAHRAA